MKQKKLEELISENDILRQRVTELELLRSKTLHDRNRKSLLNLSVEYYYKIIEENGDIISFHKINGFIFLDVNITGSKILGYSKDELLGKSAIDFIYYEDKNNILRIINDSLPRGEGTAECRFRKKDGAYSWFEVNGKVLCNETGQAIAVLFARNIDRRKQVEAALRESEDKFRKLTDTVPALIYVAHVEDGILLYVNSAFETITGYNIEECMNMNVYDTLMTDHPSYPAYTNTKAISIVKSMEGTRSDGNCI